MQNTAGPDLDRPTSPDWENPFWGPIYAH